MTRLGRGRRAPRAAATDGASGGGERIPLVHVITVPFCLHFIAGQVGFMTARGFDVSAVTSPGEQLDEFGRREGVAVHAVEMVRRVAPGRDVVALWRVFRYLQRVRPHIVHSHTPKAGLLGTIAAWLARVPVRVYHIRGLPYVTATGTRRVLLRWTERTACTLAHQVLCVSHSVRDVAVAEGICRADKVKVLLGGSGNGVDAGHRFAPARWAHTRDEVRAKYGIPTDAVVVGFVGRVVRDKGLTQLAEAWRVLREEHATLHVLVVGDFEPQDPLPPDVVELLRGDPRIHVTGWEWDTPRLYAAMDLLVLPTYREGLSNVLLEAAAMALPAVATRIPGCTDVVEEGVTGTLVPARDAPALTDALRTYVEDAGLRAAHGAAARERVLRSFGRDAIWGALYDEYQRLLGVAPEPGAAAAAPRAVGPARGEKSREWGLP